MNFIRKIKGLDRGVDVQSPYIPAPRFNRQPCCVSPIGIIKPLSDAARGLKRGYADSIELTYL